MDFAIPEELQALQQLSRRFVKDEMMSLEKDVLSGKLLVDGVDLPEETYRHLLKRAKEIGLWICDVPETFGGGGVGAFGSILVEEERAKSLTPFTLRPFGLDTLFACNEEQRKKYLDPVLSGEKQVCFAMTEPGAGSDAQALQTTAVKQGDSYVINGSKIFISHAAKADFAIVFAVTDKEKRARGGITAFLVDRDTPGYSVGRLIQTMGMDSVSEIFFEDCTVPEKNILGELGKGFYLGMEFLNVARASIGARSVGIADRCQAMSVAYARQRVAFGKPIAERQAIQWMLVDSAIEIHAARMMTYHCAWKIDQGLDPRIEASIVKLYGSEMVGRVVDRAIQVHGGLGYSRDLPLEAFYRGIRVYRIYDGTSEIHRLIIARNLLRD